MLYFVDEPAPDARRTTFRKKVFVRYPQQKSFPAPRTDFNYDCEAVFTLGQEVLLLTKHRSDTATRVYRLNNTSEGVVHELELLQRVEMGGQVVAADASPDGKSIVVATYDKLWLYDVRDPQRPLDVPMRTLSFEAEQVEAVAFADDATVLFADEATALLYEARLEDFEPLAHPVEDEHPR